MNSVRILRFFLGVVLLVGAYFAPLFIGVARQLTVYDAGSIAIQFLYVVPLCDYGFWTSVESSILTLLYVMLPICLGLWYLITAIVDY